MLSMVFGIPVVFGLMVWKSYRTQRTPGSRYEPQGKLRWEDSGS